MEVSYKLIENLDDPDIYHALRLRYKGYFEGKNKTMSAIPDNVEMRNGEYIMKLDSYDQYSTTLLMFVDDVPVGTCRYTPHIDNDRPAPMAKVYPEIIQKADSNKILETSRAAIEEEYRGLGSLLFLIYFTGVVTISLKNNIRYIYFEAPLKLASVYNRYLGAKLVYSEPRLYPGNQLPIYLMTIDTGTVDSFLRKRFKMADLFFSWLWDHHDNAYIGKMLLPLAVVFQRVLFINEKIVDFPKKIDKEKVSLTK